MRFRCVPCVSVLLASPAWAREPVSLQPVSPWNLRYEENSCRLVRAFGSTAEPTVMVLERVSPGSELTMMVYGKALKSRMGQRADAAFLPFTANLMEDGDVGETTGTKEPVIYWTSVAFRSASEKKSDRDARYAQELRDLAYEAAERAREAEVTKAVTGLEITERGGRKVFLQTGAMSRGIAMLRECAREQLVHWGVDPDLQDKIVRSAKVIVPLDRFFSSSDYPRSGLMSGAQSVIKARLLIDDKGVVTKCTSLTAFSAPDFAEVVCARLKRAKFRPAALADGTTVPTYTTTTIKFVMP